MKKNLLMPKAWIPTLFVIFFSFSLIVTITVTPLHAQFAGGDGTKGDPYQIANVNQLQLMKNHLSSHFILINNIDASSIQNFEPVGTGVNQFKGSLNGNSKVITGLRIDRPSQDPVGLFGYTQTNLNDTLIKNLGLENANIKGRDGVGALIGYKDGGSIINSYSTGSVNGNNFTGGLVGFNHGGAISNSYSTDSVSGESSAGGLVGHNTGSINGSYSTGSVHGNNYLGGLIGSNFGSITSSYATGNVSGQIGIGGLAGRSENGEITNCYSTGNVHGDGGIGGFIGENSGSITGSYSAGSVSGIYSVGGFAGSSNGIITHCYWDTTTSGQSASAGGTGLPDSQFRHQASFTGFDFIQNWNIMENLSYPFLRYNPQNPAPGYPYPFAGGDGSANNPFIIENIDLLQTMKNFLSSHFILNNNIDASVTSGWNNGLGFEPVGTQTTPFTGSLNGAGFKITGLTINRTDEYLVGLFGFNSGKVTDLGLEDAGIAGFEYVGGLVGFNGGTITNSYVTGNVSGSYFAGGLVGVNIQGSIADSYAIGSVSGGTQVGGLAGNNGGTITNSYAAGQVLSHGGAGGLVGNNLNGKVTSSYWNITTSGQSSSDGGTGLNDAQFRNQASFTGFDFAVVWDIREGSSFPFLRSNPQDPPPGSHPMVGSPLPTEYALSQNYPNPFNPVTKINYEIPVEGFTKLTVYDVSGREVAVLINEVTTPGYYTVEFNGSNFASGVYFYRLVAGSAVISKKMVLVK